MVTLHAPGSLSSCSFDGVEYKIADGLVNVPEAAVASLLAHGFTLGEPTAAPLSPEAADLAAAEQLIKEQEGVIASLRADLAAKGKGK